MSEDGVFQRHLQMLGFSSENVEEFVQKYLGQTEGKKMIAELKKQPSLESLMHTPFFALLICEQFKEASELPSTRTNVFSRLVIRLLQRFVKSRGQKANFKKLEDISADLLDKALEVGKVAFERLKRKDLAYFELAAEGLSEDAVELGFLEHVQASSPDGSDQYGFRHLTVQEYLAALYACRTLMKTSANIDHLVEELGSGKK